MPEYGELNVNRKLLAKVFMDAIDPIIIEDLNGDVVEMNREAERVYGWTREELIGKPIKTIVPPDRHGQADELLERCKSGLEVRNVEGLRWNRKQKTMDVLITLFLLKDDDGEPAAVATLVKDISHQKQLEEKLRRMSKVFMDATVPILIEDLDGVVQDMNKEAERAYNWPREELLGKPIKTIVPPERHSEADELLKRSKMGERVENIEGLRWTRNEKILDVLLTLSVLHDDEGVPMGIATIAKDITALKKAEAKVILTQDVTIESMGTLAEYRDPETGGHIKRTRAYVKLLAAHLKNHPKYRDYLTEETIELLYKSAPLHDIGKVAISDNILLKPGKLTDKEFESMKMHTVYGMEAIAIQENRLGKDDFLHLAYEIAGTHQEKYEGTGYPNGLVGEEIPIAGRLMAIADVYDALISKRVYKPPFPHSKACKIIEEGKGKHFDPDMVDAFLQLKEEFKEIALKYADFDEERDNLMKE